MDETLPAPTPKRGSGLFVAIIALILFVLVILGTIFLRNMIRVNEYTRAMANCRTVLTMQVEAWNQGDLDGFMAGYDENVNFYSDNTIETGAGPLKDRYYRRYKAEGKEMGKLTFADVKYDPVSGTSVFVTGHWKVEKSKETSQGLFTLLLRQTDAGWRIVHDHTSAEPKKP